MTITPELIKQVREQTGLSVMDCKRALEETGGDIEKSLILLRKQSSAAAQKKSSRTLGAGTVAAYIHTSKDIGAMVALACETDFVAKNPEFMALAYDIAMHVAATAPTWKTQDEVAESDLVKAKELFVDEARSKPEEMRAKIVEGKLASYRKEKVLVEQEYIKDPSRTIQDLIDGATQKFGERVEVADMARFSVR